MSARAILAEALALPSTATTDQVAQALADHLTAEPRPLGLPDMLDTLAPPWVRLPRCRKPPAIGSTNSPSFGPKSRGPTWPRRTPANP
jgi:hypothetical protein